MKNTLFGIDIVSIDSLSKRDIEVIFEKTKEMEQLVKERGGDDRLSGRIIAAIFFEPSTRTFSSFIAAGERLGAGIIPLNGMKNTSVEKGESFEHTVQVFSRYADCLVIRHPEPGKPRLAADIVHVPVINAGDGINEHPTQALFDTFTIRQHFSGLKSLTVTMVGDLKNGRTVHSLTKALIKTGSRLQLNLVSPQVLSMPQEIINQVTKTGSQFKETTDLAPIIPESDVIYMTRVQKERFEDIGEYEKLKNFYVLNRRLMKTAKNNVLVMHPLPIAAGEIDNDLDDDRRSVYLNDQLSNGMYLRMALLDLILQRR